ncbi:DHH family phosphoesterase [Corynebacterium hindlerae]|uniref:DHH family phosphoesterase n=1 Tax=Corynebacterium hindlerae TaxID=699041 RepID=UPI003AAFE989
MDFRAATAAVNEASTIAVMGHIRPDADAIGSVTTVLQALHQLGKTASGWIGQPDAFAANLLSIPLADQITCTTELPEADLYVVLDCGSLDRTGAFSSALSDTDTPIIMVDHHASNTGFGTWQLLDPTAESTTTILRAWLRDLGVELTTSIAHSIYAGLVTDTGSFRWGRPAMHELAGELVATGIDTRCIAGALMDDVSIPGLRMVGQVLSAITVPEIDGHRVAILTASHDLIQGCAMNEVESLVDYVRGVGAADVGAVFKEYRPGWFAVSLRTTKDIDVSAIAARIGGGGHVRAAGYTTTGTVAEVHQELLAAVGAVLN